MEKTDMRVQTRQTILNIQGTLASELMCQLRAMQGHHHVWIVNNEDQDDLLARISPYISNSIAMLRDYRRAQEALECNIFGEVPSTYHRDMVEYYALKAMLTQDDSNAVFQPGA
jgi:hypothetical protein